MPSIWQKHPGSPKQRSEKSNAKPPLPNNTASQFRKGTYHESLDFVQSLCETSYGLVDVFPIEDRKSALREVVHMFSSLFHVTHGNACIHIYVYPFDCLTCFSFVFLVTCRDQSSHC